MDTRISTVELSDELSDVLDRVNANGERFVVERNGIAIAVLQPASVEKRPQLTLHQIAARLAHIPRPDPEFANDLEAIHREVNAPIEPPDWPS